MSVIEGRVWRYGDNVNTDVIFPGKYTYTLRGREEIAQHALEDLDPNFVHQVQAGDIIVAGRNWGCGSSREQAATCLAYNGVAALIAESFGRIFYRNALNSGLLAIACPQAARAIQRLHDTDESHGLSRVRICVDLNQSVISLVDDRQLSTSDIEPKQEWPFPPFSPSVMAMIDAGGLVESVKQRLQTESLQPHNLQPDSLTAKVV